MDSCGNCGREVQFGSYAIAFGDPRTFCSRECVSKQNRKNNA